MKKATPKPLKKRPGRPAKDPPPYDWVMIQIRVPEHIKTAFVEALDRDGKTMTFVLRHAVDEYIASHQD